MIVVEGLYYYNIGETVGQMENEEQGADTCEPMELHHKMIKK